MPAILINLLNNPHNNINKISLEALEDYQVKSDDIDEIKTLLKNLIINEDPEIRSLVIERLIELGCKSIISWLIDDYYHEYYFGRWNIVKLLGKTKDKSILKYLIYGLYDENHSVCWQAAEKSGNIGGDLAFDVLLHGLCQKIKNEESRYVLNDCISEALEKINIDKSIKKLSLILQCNDAYVSKNVLGVLRKFSAKSVLSIIKTALDDKDNCLL